MIYGWRDIICQKGFSWGVISISIKTHPKKFWKYASVQKPSRHSVTELSVNKNVTIHPEDIDETLNKQFKSVFAPPGKNLLPEILEYNIEKHIHIMTIKPLDIEQQLKKLNPNKSVGPDRAHPWILKEAHLEFAPPSANLFQKTSAYNRNSSRLAKCK